MIAALIMIGAFLATALTCWCALCAVAARQNGYVRKYRLYLLLAFGGASACLILTALMFQEAGSSWPLWVLLVAEGASVLTAGLLATAYLRIKYRDSR